MKRIISIILIIALFCPVFSMAEEMPGLDNQPMRIAFEDEEVTPDWDELLILNSNVSVVSASERAALVKQFDFMDTTIPAFKLNINGIALFFQINMKNARLSLDVDLQAFEVNHIAFSGDIVLQTGVEIEASMEEALWERSLVLFNIPFKGPYGITLSLKAYLNYGFEGEINLTFRKVDHFSIEYNGRDISFKNNEAARNTSLYVEGADYFGFQMETSLSVPVIGRLLSFEPEAKVRIGGSQCRQFESDTYNPWCVDGFLETGVEWSVKAGLLDLAKNLKKINELALYAEYKGEGKISKMWYHFEDGKPVRECTVEKDGECIFLDYYTGTRYEKVESRVGRLLSRPFTPEKQGYVFDGWYYMSDGYMRKWDFDNDIVEENEMYLFALWSEIEAPMEMPTPTPTPAPSSTVTAAPTNSANPQPTIAPTLAVGNYEMIPSRLTYEEADRLGFGFSMDSEGNGIVMVNAYRRMQGAWEIPSQVTVLDSWYVTEENERYQAPRTYTITKLEYIGWNDNSAVDIYAPYIKEIGDGSMTAKGGGLRSISCPNATSVAECAFCGCETLISVNLPEVTELGEQAFEGCSSLKNVYLPKLNEIKQRTFEDCTSLESVAFINVSKVGESAFERCTSLKSVYLPNLREIDGGAFLWCEALSDVTVYDARLPMDMCYYPIRNITFTTTGEVPDHAVFGGYSDFSGKLRTIHCPNATKIGDEAFLGLHSLDSIEGPNVKTIGNEAFARCTSLKTVDFPNVIEIGEDAFDLNDSLVSISLPKAEILGSGAFDTCYSLSSVEFPNAVSVGYRTFCHCESLTSINLPKAEKLGEAAFADCYSLTSAEFANVTEIGESAFGACIALACISLPKAEKLGERAFVNCNSLTTAELANATEIGEAAFEGCKALTLLNLPKVETLGANAIQFCESLKRLELPSIRVIEGRQGRESLDELVIGSEAELLYDVGFAKVTYIHSRKVRFVGESISISTGEKPNIIYCPRGSQIYDDLCGFMGICFALLYLDEPVKVTFHYEDGSEPVVMTVNDITKVPFPEMREREGYTFLRWWDEQKWCSAENSWYYVYCSDLHLYANWAANERVHYDVVNGKFQNARIDNYGAPPVVNIPQGVTEIVGGAVQGNTKTVVIPASVTTISPTAFTYASYLKSIEVDENNAYFRSEDGVLYSKDGRTLLAYPAARPDQEYTLPASVSTVSDAAFGYNSDLSVLRVLNGDVEISSSAFKNCYALKAICAPGGCELLREIAEELSVQYNPASITLVIDEDTQYMIDGTVADTLWECAAMPLSVLARSQDDYDRNTAIIGWSLTENGDILNLESYVLNDETLTIYAVKGQAYEFTIANGKATITKCNLNRASVDIPVSISGTPVSAIQAGTFASVTQQLVGRRGSFVETYANARGLDFVASKTTVVLMNGDEMLYSYPVEEGQTFVMPRESKDGYVTDGWKKPDGTLWNFDSDVAPAGTLVLFAKWRQIGENELFIWEKKGNEITITGMNASKTVVEIPEMLDGMPVTAIGDYAFAQRTTIEQVFIPDSVRSIGTCAFVGCQYLQVLQLGEGLEEIGKDAFNGCSGLRELSLPSALKSIGAGCFSGTGITSLAIGRNVTQIGVGVTAGCIALAEITVDGDNTHIAVRDGMLMTNDGSMIVAYAVASNAPSVEIPSGVTEIGDYAFMGGRFSTLSIPESVRTIGSYAFSNCTNVELLTLPENLERLGSYAFAGCGGLYRVIAGSALTTIGDGLFTAKNVTFECAKECALIRWAIDNGYQKIRIAFTNECRLPQGLLMIEEEALYGCNFDYVYIPGQCTSIESKALAYSNELLCVYIPASVTYIADDAFEGCGDVILAVDVGSYAHSFAAIRDYTYIVNE